MKGLRPLSSVIFLIALFLLLVNDLFLKGFFHNVWTGKLSDFAGLFVFAVFWCSIFPRWKGTLLGVTGSLFIFWKSPFSQGAIEFWNALPLFEVERVVDMSDLLALSVLPLAFYHERLEEKLGRVRLSPSIPFLLSAFAFMATSYRSDMAYRKTYEFPVQEDSLMKRMHEEAVRVDALRLWERRPGDTVAHVHVHRLTGDTLSTERFAYKKKRLGDTIVVGVRDTGLGHFKVELGIEALKKGSRIRTYKIRYPAPNKKEYEDRLPMVFEERSIDKLRGERASPGQR